ncbi:MAG TPA: hypothetical protein VNQ77_01995 [Frankiaceae bacterium]|nr:hypothetical protein [Frankiaceae bacterium]
MSPLRPTFALLAAGLALCAVPAGAECVTYEPGPTMNYPDSPVPLPSTPLHVVAIYGPGTLSVTPTDCP